MDAQAWEKVDELIDRNQTKTIKDLFAEDGDRAAKFSLEAAGGSSTTRRTASTRRR